MILEVKNNDVQFGTNILEVKIDDELRKKIETKVSVFDFALGGFGATPSQCIMFTGVPGGGKTTLILKLADRLTKHDNICLFNGLEESPEQVGITCERLNIKNGFLIGQESDVEKLLMKCELLQKKIGDKKIFLFIDSLQCMEEEHSSIQALSHITSWCKRTKNVAFVVGMVGKDGKFSGKNKLKHMVDTFLELSIEKKDPDFMGYRVIETTKNRFGIAGQKIWFDIQNNGKIQEIARMGDIKLSYD